VEGADALGLIAEVGIAIAGFAGVIATLRAPGGKVRAYAAFRIGILLGLSGSTVLLALLPFAFEFGGLASGKIWALSSVAAFVLVGSFQLIFFQLSRALTPDAPEDRPPGIRFVMVFGAAILLGINVLQLANAAWFRELWPFYVGLLMLTAYSLFSFAYLLFGTSSSEVPA
jgi:hypothetical protein